MCVFIFERVEEEMAHYRMKTGEDPSYLFLGQKEWKEFKVFCCNLFPIQTQEKIIKELSYCNMRIIKVEEDQFLSVG